MWKVKLDRAGVGNILRKGKVPEMVDRVAEEVADQVRARIPDDIDPPDDGEMVVVESYTTDRGAAAVVVRHPAAIGLQAKYGIVTDAAAAIGLTVKGGS